MPDSWTTRHFSLAVPVGTDRSNVPVLLRRLADTLEEYGRIDVQDVVMHTEVRDEKVHSFTVYFREADEQSKGLRLVGDAPDSSEDAQSTGRE